MSDDRSLDEIFQYESAKRAGAEGIALAALGGDRAAIKNFAGLSLVALGSENDDFRQTVLPWLEFVLGQIQGGKEPNEAFGWARKRRGAPSPSQDMAGLTKQWLIGQHMHGLIAATGCSVRSAAAAVSEARNVSAPEAERCYRKWLRK